MSIKTKTYAPQPTNWFRKIVTGGSLSLIIAALCLATVTQAATIVGYEFTGFTYNPTILASHVTGTNYGFYADIGTVTGINLQGNPGNAFYAIPATTGAGSYMFFQIQLENQYSLTLSNLTFDSRRVTNAATSFDVKYSMNGVDFTSIGNGSLTGTNWQTMTANNLGTPIADLTGTVYFRIYGAGWSGSYNDNRRWYQDNVQVNGTVSAIPEPSSMFLVAWAAAAVIVMRRRNRFG